MVVYNPDTGEYEEVSGGGVTSQNLPANNPDPNDANTPPPGTGGGGTAPPTPPATSAAAQTIIDYYNTYLGRAPGAGDVDKWLSGAYGWGDTNNLAGIKTGIQLSDEGSRYGATHAPATVAPYSNFATTGNDYSAFNTARQQDPNASAKDSFVYWSNRAPAPPLGDKAAMQTWFQSYIAPGMNAQGHKVSSINGDSFTYSDGQGTFTVDYAQNAGGAAGKDRRLQWNTTPADAATQARYGTGTQSSSLSTGGGGAGGGGGYGGGAGGGINGLSGLDLPHYEPYPEWHPTDWVPPKPEDVRNDPAYQFRLDESLKPLVNMRALAGLTRGGGTMKATERQAGNFASDEYGRIYDRAQSDWLNTNNMSHTAWVGNAGEHNNAYNNWTNEAQNEWNADWDVYQYNNDDAFRYWNSKLTAATTGAGFGTNNP